MPLQPSSQRRSLFGRALRHECLEPRQMLSANSSAASWQNPIELDNADTAIGVPSIGQDVVLAAGATPADSTSANSGGLLPQTTNIESPPLAAGRTPWQTDPIQIASDRLVATDGLGRELPGFDEVGAPRPDKYVGMFYFLWQGQHNANAVYDLTEMIAANPTNPQYGPESAFHWWGEPEAGYYRAEDPWVIRRNLHMLADIGVDVLFFDVTNAFTYHDNAVKVMNIAYGMRLAGIETPSFAFLTHSGTGATVNDLYNNIYNPGLLSDVWFRWQGKPLILGDLSQPGISPAAQNFFTWKYSWAWTDAANQPDHWQWIDEYPQDYGWDTDPTIPEEIPVALASHPVNNRGTSYSGGVEPPRDGFELTRYTGTGRHFDQQWQRALEVDPEMIFVTGWNEWVAQRFTKQPGSGPSEFLGKPLANGDTYFVDLYNEEYNRDIAPMKGGHTDNYYYQLAAEIRRFKGVRAPDAPAGETAITIDGQFGDWTGVGPDFSDFANDTLHRNWPRYDNAFNYVNNTGRNDIVQSRVGAGGSQLYFYAKTNGNLSPWSDPQWMMLFIDADQNKLTGWEGYDYAVNLSVLSSEQTTLSEWDGAAWTSIATVDYRAAGSQLEIAVDRDLLGMTADSVDFDFHWADNVGPLNDVSAFFVNGDSAPNRRFDYRFAATSPFEVAMTGDFNSDSSTDGSDFLAWQRGFGISSGATLPQGDGDGNGAVDSADLGYWTQDYGLLGATNLVEATQESPTPQPWWFALPAQLSAASFLATGEAPASSRPHSELSPVAIDSLFNNDLEPLDVVPLPLVEQALTNSYERSTDRLSEKATPPFADAVAAVMDRLFAQIDR